MIEVKPYSYVVVFTPCHLDSFTGVVPATNFLKDSGIKMTDRGFLPVNDVGDMFSAHV